jgi:hypothetical protein
MVQATEDATRTAKPVISLDIPTLNEVALRLRERSDTIRQVTLVDLVQDLLIAARACDVLAHVRFRIAEIAANALTHPNWDRAAFARDLRELLDENDEGDR